MGMTHCMLAINPFVALMNEIRVGFKDLLNDKVQWP